MMSAAVAGTTFRPTPSYTTLRDVTSWALASLSCLISLFGLTTNVFVAMLPAAVLTVWAVVAAPLAPEPTW